MSIKLIVEVLDHAPSELSAAERLVLVALAEKARDDTRVVLPSREDDACATCQVDKDSCSGRNDQGQAGSCCPDCRHRLTVRETLQRRVGLSSEGLTKVLRRLAARTPSLETRVELRRNKDDSPVFAWEGVASRFRVPHLKPAKADHQGAISVIHSMDSEAPSQGQAPTEGGPQGTLARTTGHPLEPERVDERAGYIPQSLSDPSSTRAERVDERAPSESGARQAPLQHVPPDHRDAVLELLTRLGSAIDEADAVDCVAWVAHRGKDNPAAYVSKFPATDVLERAQQWRVKSAGTGRPKVHRRARCGNDLCNEQGWLGEDADARPIPCPVCKPHASRRRAAS